MTDLLLPLSAVILAALLGVALLGFASPRHARQLLWTAGALSGLAAVFALIALLAGATPGPLGLPLGLPGMDFRLQLDPLAAFFVLLLFGTGAALCLALALPPLAEAAAGPVPLALAAFGLAVLAAGPAPRACGIALAGGAIWLLQPAGRANAAPLAATLLAAGAIAVAGAARSPALLWLALLGPGAMAGLAPWHGWVVPAQAGSTPAAAILAGAAAPVGAYAALRMLFAASVPPGWWGLPWLVLGAVSVLASAWQEARQAELDATVAAATVRQTGSIALGIGLALTARGADLPDVAAMALGAVLLLAASQAIGGTLLALAAGAMQRGAGTQALDRMGGLLHRMPATTACLLTGMVSLAALPPGAGFAALWLLLHAVLGLPHAAALPFRLLPCALTAVLGLTAAFSVASLLRVAAVACLGRPRTPRAAVAEEQPRLARHALVTLAGAALTWGVLAGPLLRLLANAPVHALIGTGLGPLAGWLGVAQGAESPGYAAAPMTVLLLCLGAAAVWLRRRRLARTGTLEGPAWADGFAAPPGWLPFGDPTTQADGRGFLPLPPQWRGPRLRLPHLPRLPAPALALLLAAALLAICAWIPPA